MGRRGTPPPLKLTFIPSERGTLCRRRRRPPFPLSIRLSRDYHRHRVVLLLLVGQHGGGLGHPPSQPKHGRDSDGRERDAAQGRERLSLSDVASLSKVHCSASERASQRGLRERRKIRVTFVVFPLQIMAQLLLGKVAWAERMADSVRSPQPHLSHN